MSDFRPYFQMHGVNYAEDYYEQRRKEKAAEELAATENPYQYTPSPEDLRKIRGNALVSLGGGLLSSLDPNMPGGVNWGGLGEGVKAAQNTMLGMHDQLAEKHSKEALWKQERQKRDEDMLHRQNMLTLSERSADVADENLGIRRDEMEYRRAAPEREDAEEAKLRKQVVTMIHQGRSNKFLSKDEETNLVNMALINPSGAYEEYQYATRDINPTAATEPWMNARDREMAQSNLESDFYATFPKSSEFARRVDRLKNAGAWAEINKSFADIDDPRKLMNAKLKPGALTLINKLVTDDHTDAWYLSLGERAEAVYREGKNEQPKNKKDWTAQNEDGTYIQELDLLDPFNRNRESVIDSLAQTGRFTEEDMAKATSDADVSARRRHSDLLMDYSTDTEIRRHSFSSVVQRSGLPLAEVNDLLKELAFDVSGGMPQDRIMQEYGQLFFDRMVEKGKMTAADEEAVERVYGLVSSLLEIIQNRQGLVPEF